MSRSRAFVVAILSVVAAAVTAQTPLTQAWKVQADDAAVSTWFTSADATASSVRGADVNRVTTGSVIAAAVLGGTALYRLSKANGSLLTPSTVPGPFTISGTGARNMNKVVVTSDGVIYSCSLSLGGASNNFKIWRNGDETAAATEAFSQTANPTRMGDDMAVTGTGNGTKLLVAQSGPATLVAFTTTDGGVTFTSSTLTPTSPGLSGTPAVAWDPNGTDYWFRNTATTGAQKYSGATNIGAGSPLAGDVGQAAYGPIGTTAYDGKTIVGVGIGNSSATTTGKLVNFFDAANATTPIYTAAGTEFTGGAKTNGNGQGDVSFDPAAGRAYILYSNNSITAYNLPTPARVSDWNLF